LKLIFAIHKNEKILSDYTLLLTTWLSILTILFVNNDTRTYSDGNYMFSDIN